MKLVKKDEIIAKEKEVANAKASTARAEYEALRKKTAAILRVGQLQLEDYLINGKNSKITQEQVNQWNKLQRDINLPQINAINKNLSEYAKKEAAIMEGNVPNIAYWAKIINATKRESEALNALAQAYKKANDASNDAFENSLGVELKKDQLLADRNKKETKAAKDQERTQVTVGEDI